MSLFMKIFKHYQIIWQLFKSGNFGCYSKFLTHLCKLKTGFGNRFASSKQTLAFFYLTFNSTSEDRDYFLPDLHPVKGSWCFKKKAVSWENLISWSISAVKQEKDLKMSSNNQPATIPKSIKFLFGGSAG